MPQLSGERGSLWLGAFVGFLVIVFLGLWLPVVAQFIGGIVAGVIAKGGAGRGALAGFLEGIFGGIIVAVFAVAVG